MHEFTRKIITTRIYTKKVWLTRMHELIVNMGIYTVSMKLRWTLLKMTTPNSNRTHMKTKL